jgi:hypothetical protein
MIIIIDLSYIMYNDLWLWNRTKLNYHATKYQGVMVRIQICTEKSDKTRLIFLA